MALARHVLRLPQRIRARGPLVKRVSERVRSRHLLALDVIGLVLAVLAALTIWRNAVPDLAVIGAYLWIGGIVVASRVAVDILLGLYTHSWRFASVGDMGNILGCVIVGSAASIAIVSMAMLLDPNVAAGPPPAAFWVLEGAFALGVLATPRFLIRAASDLPGAHTGAASPERTLLYGAGWAGVMIARSAERSPETNVVPVGFLDDNPDLRGRRVNGLRVFGDTADMARAKRRTGATSLLITMPRATGESVRHVVEAALGTGLDVRTVPSVTDLIDGTIDTSRIREVRVEDLLRRPPARDHSPALRELLQGKTVMITGAAGSIGSELVRQVLALDPGRVVMVDTAESAMYMCARDLESRLSVRHGKTSVSTHLVDVTDGPAITRLMQETSPVIVFHAAAYKHVPLLEDHVSQAVRTNVGGTLSVVEAAVAAGVERFVLVSTDKAVEPSSVMGATKRVAEMTVADAARRTGKAYASVRFGNVLGSNGSVIPVFQAQLQSGQPLTITDPEMTRYFMTIPEAAWLILDAAALAEQGDLFVLDMGEPVRILDVARDLVRLSGRDPDSVPIKVTGLRPGEKLHEELFYADEMVTPTDVPKVMRTVSAPPPAAVRGQLDDLLGMARSGDDGSLRAALLDYVKRSADAGEPELAADGFGWETAAGSTDTTLRPVVAVPVHANGAQPERNGAGIAAASSRAAGNGAPPQRISIERRFVISPSVISDGGRSEDDDRSLTLRPAHDD